MGLLLKVIFVDVRDPKLTRSSFKKQLVLTCKRFAPAELEAGMAFYVAASARGGVARR